MPSTCKNRKKTMKTNKTNKDEYGFLEIHPKLRHLSSFSAPRNQRPLCLRPHSLYALSNMGRGSRYLPDTENPRILLGRMAGWARNSAGAFVRPAVQSF